MNCDQEVKVLYLLPFVANLLLPTYRDIYVYENGFNYSRYNEILSRQNNICILCYTLLLVILQTDKSLYLIQLDQLSTNSLNPFF